VVVSAAAGAAGLQKEAIFLYDVLCLIFVSLIYNLEGLKILLSVQNEE